MNSLTYSLDYGCPNGRESAVGQGFVRRRKNWVAKARVQWCGCVFFGEVLDGRRGEKGEKMQLNAQSPTMYHQQWDVPYWQMQFFLKPSTKGCFLERAWNMDMTSSSNSTVWLTDCLRAMSYDQRVLCTEVRTAEVIIGLMLQAARHDSILQCGCE